MIVIFYCVCNCKFYFVFLQSFIQPRQSIPQNIRPTTQQRPPINIASSPGQPMYAANPPPQAVQTTMFVPGQNFIPGQHQIIVQQGAPPPLQVPGVSCYEWYRSKSDTIFCLLYEL